jgi:hypothetical protein
METFSENPNGNGDTKFKFFLTVTPFSKILAFILFITLPFVGFYIGLKYQNSYTAQISDRQQMIGDNSSNVSTDINRTSLYFLQNEKLYKLSPLDSAPVIYLDKVDSYSFSPDKKKIAFIREYGGVDNNIYVNEVESGKNLLTINRGNININRGVSWSIDGDYLLVNAGTGPRGSTTVFDSISGSQLSSFRDGHFGWLDKQNIIISQDKEIEPYRPWDSGAYSLNKVDVTDGKSEELIAGDVYTDYHFSNISGSCIYFTKDYVLDLGDWVDSAKIKTETYCYNPTTKTSQIVSAEETQTDFTRLREKLIILFPEHNIINKSEIIDVLSLPNYPGWALMNIYNGSNIYNSDIVLVNIDKPKETYKLIGAGANLSWTE